MICAFVQDSANAEIVAQQKERISAYAQTNGLSVENWMVPSSFDMHGLKENDVLLLEKTFRLGKDLRTIAATLQVLLSNGVTIHSCEDGLKFGGDYISSTTMAYLFGVVSEIAEELRSRLTKEALAFRKREGKVLGRPLGKKSKSRKLDAQKERIQKLMRAGKKEPEISRLLKIPRASLWLYIKEHPELKEAV
jgi:putative DNA-invertase from lambdoid prophage Rac